MADEKADALALPIPIQVEVGGKYKMISNNKVVDVEVLKIMRTPHGDVGIIFKMPRRGKMFGHEVVSTNGVDFKSRLLIGGLERVEL
jgi:hypothetical protein